MPSGSTIDTSFAAGAIIRARRRERGLSQQSLANNAGVSRKFLIDLEAGHERAEFGKTLAVLHALRLSLTAVDSVTAGRDNNPVLRDYASTFTRLIDAQDFEFAIKMLSEYATASLKIGRPLLQKNPGLADLHWSAAIAGTTDYIARRLGSPRPVWTRSVKPLAEAWLPAESFRHVREPMRELTRSETPRELAKMSVLIRERSLAVA